MKKNYRGFYDATRAGKRSFAFPPRRQKFGNVDADRAAGTCRCWTHSGISSSLHHRPPRIFLKIEKSLSLIEHHLPNWANVQQSNVKFSRKGNRRTRSSFEYSTCTNSLFTAGLKLFDEEMPEEKDEKKWLQEKIHALWIIRHSWLIEIFSDSKWEILTGSSFQLEMYRFQLFIKSHRLSYHNFTFWYFISKWSRDRSTANHVTDIYLSSDSYGLAIYRVVLMERRR